MTDLTSTPTHRRKPQTRGERGIAIALTGLVLIPLLIFAAFGVDLASYYARISELQRAADAAALAGAVWMPNLTRATTEATANLRTNGFINGADNITITIAQGATATAVRVTVTDNDVDRYFSSVFDSGPARLSRYAEAEYNLPIPLGSPLNYFGGDSSKTALPNIDVPTVTWPTDYATRPPANRPCNVGTQTSFGRWTATAYEANVMYTSGTNNRRCTWTPVTATINTPPTNSTTLAPTNVPCNVQQSPTSVQGRWNVGSPSTAAPTYSNNRHTSGTGNRQCTWVVIGATDLPANYNQTSNPPSNRPCNVPPFGRWPASGSYQANQFFNTPGGTDNVICQWQSQEGTTSVPQANPIESTRSPGFWAAIGGPGDVAQFGDAFSARCTTGTNCGSATNANYRSTGYWYVIKMPASGATSTQVRIFDASYNTNSSSTTHAGDTRGTFTSGNGFTTTFRVYRQNNPLDFTNRTALGSNTANTTDGSCHWAVRSEAAFNLQWRNLCTITPSNGEIYLLNVVTSGTSGNTDGVNGYAVEAIAGGTNTGPAQPAVYAYESMGMRNNINAGTATFYLAEVGPQYAGRTLVIEMYDAGDASGNAYVQPVMPRTSVSPVTWQTIPSSRCAYTALTAPNGSYTASAGGNTSPQVTTPTMPSISNCRIQTTNSGTGQFNGLWLNIRIDIPDTYTCTPGVNPETTTGSCWWGVQYEFSASSNDVTTWRARIEGNPLQLTQ